MKLKNFIQEFELERYNNKFKNGIYKNGNFKNIIVEGMKEKKNLNLAIEENSALLEYDVVKLEPYVLSSSSQRANVGIKIYVVCKGGKNNG